MTGRMFLPHEKPAAYKAFHIMLSYRKTFTWIIIILVLSFLPGKALERVNFLDISFQDLIVHFIMYAVLSFLIIYETFRKNAARLHSGSGWLLPFSAAFLLGIITEVVQGLWIPGRYGSIVDFAMNMSGCITVIFILKASRYKNWLR
jgi:VanZ family protein